MSMLDFFNIALRTIMCLAFIAFVVRPMLMSMVRREPNTLELEEMAQLAVNSAFSEQFLSSYAKKPVPQLESSKKDGSTASTQLPENAAVATVELTEEEQAQLNAENARLAELIKGHEEEMARRMDIAAIEAERLARLAQENSDNEQGADVDDEEESSLEKMRQSMKKEKKKPAIPAELLAGNSYEDKLMVVRYVTEQEQNRVANAIRSMIQITP
jgi:vacuolar-type H+-ATPase subunit I/STV1